MPNYYVAGGFYRDPGEINYKFSLVRPTDGLPYVWTDPLPHRTHTEHHSSLYKLGEDGKTLTLHKRGEIRDMDPTSHVLNDQQAELVRQRIASGEVYSRD